MSVWCGTLSDMSDMSDKSDFIGVPQVQKKEGAAKQRFRPQTANRLEGIICPRGVEHGVDGGSGLWTRHYRKVIAASVNLRPSQLEAAASYFGVDVRPAPIPLTFFVIL